MQAVDSGRMNLLMLSVPTDTSPTSHHHIQSFARTILGLVIDSTQRSGSEDTEAGSCTSSFLYDVPLCRCASALSTRSGRLEGLVRMPNFSTVSQ